MQQRVQGPRRVPRTSRPAAGGLARTTRSRPVGIPGSGQPPARGAGAWCGCGPPRHRPPWTRRNRPAAGDPHARRRGGVDHEQPGAGSATPGGAHRRREVRPLTQSVRRRQHRRPQAEKLGAALTATSGEDAAARTGAHPQTEAVGLGPAAVVRLEGPLAHDVLSSASVGPRARVVGGPGGCRLRSETHDLRGEAAPSRARVTGMRKQPNHRPVKGTRERPRGSNQHIWSPGFGKTP